MKKILCLLTALVASAHSLHAAALATVSAGAVQSSGLSLMDGTELTQGNLIRIGYFSLSDTQIQQNQFNLSFLNQNFVEFGIAHIGDGFGVKGHFQLSLTADANTLGLVNGQQIYMWVLAVNNPSASDTFASANAKGITQQGIFYADKTANGAWKFRSNDDIPNSTSVELADLTTNGAGATLNTSAHIVLGNFGVGTSSANIGAKNFDLVAVPEPATTALALFGGAALLLRRRRRI